ncbi:MAG: T9SS type A sorting domain-containing protein [Bacteroidota bacterium]
MKKSLLLILLLMGSLSLFAQIPEGWDPFSVDTLDVPPGYIVDNEYKIALAHYINKDTSATGERNLNRIYRLQRYKDEANPGIYVLDYGMNIDFPLYIIAEKGTGRIPMIVPEYTSTGGVLAYHFKLIGDNQTHVFKNIFFQRVNLDRAFNSDWLKGLSFDGNNTRVEIEGCVFNAFTGGSIEFIGNDNSIFLRDNVWRNGEWPSHPWIGNQGSFGNANHIDTLVFTNNTYFNNNSYMLLHEGHVADFVVIEHNTFMTSTIDAMHLRYLVNANIRSNLFYGYAAYGDTELARKSGSWFEADGDSLAHISLDALGRIASMWGKSESERVINVTNNAWYTPQALKDYYTAHANYISPKDGSVDPVTAPLWMNQRTKNMFDDGSGWPCLNESDNIGGVDPLFADTDVDSWVVGAVAQWCTEMRATSTAQGWGTASGHRNYEQYLGDDMCTGIQWPLPEGNIEITNAALLTAGHDGLPVGNLNWDPALRAQYVEPDVIDCTTTGVSYNITPEFKLYPNPAEDVLHISFDKEIQMIEVYNIVGKKITAQMNTNVRTTEINISSFPDGVYLVKIYSQGGSGTKLFIKQ